MRFQKTLNELKLELRNKNVINTIDEDQTRVYEETIQQYQDEVENLKKLITLYNS